MKVVGLDLSLTGTGLIVMNDEEVIKQRLIKSKPMGDRPIDEAKRLKQIVSVIETTITDEDGIDLVAIEGLAMGIRKTVSIMQLAGLSYLVRDMLMRNGIQFVVISPTTVKKWITGKGVGQKELMLLEVYKTYGFCCDNNNIADAFGLAKVGSAIVADNGTNSYQRDTIKILKKQL